MLLIQRIGFVALIACLATAALAADNPPNQNQAPAVGGGAPGDQPAVADPAAGLPDIPENQEEIEAVRNGEPTPSHPEKSAMPTPVDAAREARREAIDSVLSIRDAAIQALNDRLASTDLSRREPTLDRRFMTRFWALSRRPSPASRTWVNCGSMRTFPRSWANSGSGVQAGISSH